MQIETCDICRRQFVAGYGFSLMTSWVVTGHAYIAGYSCEKATHGNQHWGCTPEHAMQAAIECLQHDEHMSVNNLISKHIDMANKGLTRYSPEDEAWAKGRGKDFHIVKVT